MTLKFQELQFAYSNGERNKDFQQLCNALILGQPKSGKTSLCAREFNNYYDETYEFGEDLFLEDGKKIEFQIMDRFGKGDDEFLRAHKEIIESSNAIMLTVPHSKPDYEYLDKLMEHVVKIRQTSEFPCMIVFTKSDLEFIDPMDSMVSESGLKREFVVRRIIKKHNQLWTNPHKCQEAKWNLTLNERNYSKNYHQQIKKAKILIMDTKINGKSSIG